MNPPKGTISFSRLSDGRYSQGLGHERGAEVDQHRVHDVFTPNQPAILNFVPRGQINDRLVDALNTPGRQIIVYGESGSGKSSLVTKKLNELYEGHITTRCSRASTYDSILLDAFDQLDPYYLATHSASNSKELAVGGSAGAMFADIRAARHVAATTEHARTVPPQLNIQRLGQLLGSRDLGWILEDFHKVADSEKTVLSQAFKVFSDMSQEHPQLKIVALGATDRAREVVQYDPEIQNRIAELRVPLMEEHELQGIVANGEQLLNVSFGSLTREFIRYATGVPSVVHQLALNVCLEQGLQVTSREPITFSHDHLQKALDRYVEESSDTLKSVFERALKRHQVKKYDNTSLILTALAGGPLEGLRHRDILADIRKSEPNYPPGNLTNYLRALSSEERGAIVRVSEGGRYRFTDPLYHTFAQTQLRPRKASNTAASQRLEEIVSRALTKVFNEQLYKASSPWGLFVGDPGQRLFDEDEGDDPQKQLFDEAE